MRTCPLLAIKIESGPVTVRNGRVLHSTSGMGRLVLSLAANSAQIMESLLQYVWFDTEFLGSLGSLRRKMFNTFNIHGQLR
ncbi:hypothetical protein CEXT_417011 [Caerostris extrusa]|uniref:Uncharacterized protein n=1 Tax=Caerostris extrusa TaxID=172846 RepID=A0AAV4T977_CAEEX|nr:hypothetical protein CEXT_417011 [Caerostris extrusa]